MEALVLSLGVVPFLAGRTVLVLGLLATWFGLEHFRHDFPWLGFPALLLGAVLSLAFDGLARAGGRALSRATEFLDGAWRGLLGRAQVAFTVLLSVALAAELLRRGAGGALGAVSASTGLRVQVAGFSGDAAVLLAVGLAAWAFATTRVRLRSAFAHLPLSDDSRVGWAVFLTDAAWTLVGLPLVIALPMVGLLMALLSLGALVAVLVFVRRLSEGALVACAACRRSLHPAASQCPHCHAPREPTRLGVLGRVLSGPPDDRSTHRLDLLTVQRCPLCAQRLSGVSTVCPACGHPPIASAAEARAFARHVDVRVAALMPAFGALALIPGMGLMLGLLLYSLAPSGALRSYVRWHQALGTRLLRGAALGALGVLQPLPLVGALAGMALIAALQLWTRQAFLSSSFPEASAA